MDEMPQPCPQWLLSIQSKNIKQVEQSNTVTATHTTPFVIVLFNTLCCDIHEKEKRPFSQTLKLPVLTRVFLASLLVQILTHKRIVSVYDGKLELGPI